MSSDRSGRVGLRPDERAAMLLTLLGQQPSASLAQMPRAERGATTAATGVPREREGLAIPQFLIPEGNEQQWLDAGLEESLSVLATITGGDIVYAKPRFTSPEIRVTSLTTPSCGHGHRTRDGRCLPVRVVGLQVIPQQEHK